MVATVHRLEAEVEQLKTTLRETEQRCEIATDRARLETVALSRRMEAEAGKLEEVALTLFEQLRRVRDAGPREV